MFNNLMVRSVSGKTALVVSNTTQLMLVNYNLGSYIGGGIVAHIFNSGQTGYMSGYTSGIIVALNDVASAVWGCSSTLVGTSSLVGTGVTNNERIYATCYVGSPIAAYNCITYYGALPYEDWILGSEGDMLAIGVNKSIIPNINYGTGLTSYYWTSTEFNSTNARAITYIDNSVSTSSKASSRKVRPIRYFHIKL